MRRRAYLLAVMLLTAVVAVPGRAVAEPPTLERGMFVDYPHPHANVRPGGGGGGGKSCSLPASDLCTDFKDLRLRWATPSVDYEVNAPSGYASAIDAGFEAWENENASSSVEQLPWYGSGSASIDYTNVDATSNRTGPTFDGHNVVSFANLSSWCDRCLAVTSYWYNTFSRTIVEFDITFNTQYGWSTNGAAGTYDVRNITTHEAGHSIVLGDLYKPGDGALTMYGYADVNETAKRDLGAGDVLGLRKAYPD